jgi:GcrA cell cycle regulator
MGLKGNWIESGPGTRQCRNLNGRRGKAGAAKAKEAAPPSLDILTGSPRPPTRDGIAEKTGGASKRLSFPSGVAKPIATNPEELLRLQRMAFDVDFAHPILSLTEYTCRWPIGDPQQTGFRYCCEPAPLEEAYCAKHKAEAKGERRRAA